MSDFSELQFAKLPSSPESPWSPLARPPVNAQHRESRLELISIFDRLGLRDDVRAIVLTGEGKCFSAGADLKERRIDRIETRGIRRTQPDRARLVRRCDRMSQARGRRDQRRRHRRGLRARHGLRHRHRVGKLVLCDDRSQFRHGRRRAPSMRAFSRPTPG